jgi:hypothetical protein
MLTAFSIESRAQGGQLSLADILIALRSKKVTLTDRNKILTEAINSRGTTFTLTPEIEKELTVTVRIRCCSTRSAGGRRSPKVSAVMPPPVDREQRSSRQRTEPVAQPPAPGHGVL